MFCNNRKDIEDIKKNLDRLERTCSAQSTLIDAAYKSIRSLSKDKSSEPTSEWIRFSDAKPEPGKRYLVAYHQTAFASFGPTLILLDYCCCTGWTHDNKTAYFRQLYIDPKDAVKNSDIFWKDIPETLKTVPWSPNEK